MQREPILNRNAFRSEDSISVFKIGPRCAHNGQPPDESANVDLFFMVEMPRDQAGKAAMHMWKDFDEFPWGMSPLWGSMYSPLILFDKTTKLCNCM